MSTTVSIVGSSSDGRLEKTGLTWAAVPAATPNVMQDTFETMWRCLTGGSYRLGRLYLGFDMTRFASVTITSATLYIRTNNGGSTPCTLHYKDWGASLDSGDWSAVLGTAASGTIDIGSGNKWTAVSLINVSNILTSNGRFELALNDETTTPTDASNSFNMTMGSDTSNPYYLSITYTGTVDPYTYYVDGVSGLDSNTGLSGHPWQTIEKVNNTGLVPGDQVLFKRGQTFAPASTYSHGLVPPGGGEMANPVVYGSYSTGALPIIRGSNWVLTGSGTAGNWTDYTATVANTWYMTPVCDPLRLEWGGVEYWPAESAAAVNSTNRWYYGTIGGVAGRLLIYSAAGNPATAGLVIHNAACDSYTPLQIVGKSYITIQDIELQSGAFAGQIYGATGMPCSYITIQRCNIGWMSGGKFAISYYASENCNHVTIANCTVDSGASAAGAMYNPSGVGHVVVDGINATGCDYISIHDNVFKDWWHSCIYFTDLGAGGTVNYGAVYNNVMSSPNVCYCRGVGLDGSADGKVSYNNIHHNTITNMSCQQEINGDHNTFAYNKVVGPTQRGLYPASTASYSCVSMAGYSGPCHHNLIIGNRFSDCDGPGVDLSGVDGWGNKHDNIIMENSILRCGARGCSGVYPAHTYLNVMNHSSVLGNTFSHNHIYDQTTANTVLYRTAWDAGLATVAAFNADDGTNSDVITDNDTALGWFGSGGIWWAL